MFLMVIDQDLKIDFLMDVNLRAHILMLDTRTAFSLNLIYWSLIDSSNFDFHRNLYNK